MTPPLQDILLVGRGSYLGYHLVQHCGTIHNIDSFPPQYEFPTSTTDLKRLLEERMDRLTHLEWLVIVPDPHHGLRTLILQILEEILFALSEKCPGRLSNIMFFSHIGADDHAMKDGRIRCSELFKFEKFLMSISKKNAAATVVVRTALFQEQLYFLLPSLSQGTVATPVGLSNINPVAIRDVVHFACAVIDPSNKLKVRRQIFTLTGDGQWPRTHRLYKVFKSYGCEKGNKECTVFQYDDPNMGKIYESLLPSLHKADKCCDPPFWPSSMEVEIIEEYLWYASWEGKPASAVSVDFGTLINNRSVRSVSYVCEVMAKVLS
ncbi:hypothetical protein BGZ83_005922 [Gryganskiella cystojenkinii]|nr:hypothetical protein BGZ83_005922 [Gryganskiella cystojenkinii]